MQFSLIIFDWSGTISDDRFPVYKSNMQVLENYLKPTMTFADWQVQSKGSAVDFFKAQGVVEQEQVLYNKYKEFYTAENEQGNLPQVYAEANEVLVQVQQMKIEMLVVSSHPLEKVEAEAKRYGIAHFFSQIYSTANKAESILEIIAAHKLPKEQVLGVGDTVFDLTQYQQAGIKSLAIGHGYHRLERLLACQPDFHSQDLQGLVELLGNRRN